MINSTTQLNRIKLLLKSGNNPGIKSNRKDISTITGLWLKTWLSVLLFTLSSASLHAAVNFEAKITRVDLKTKMLMGRSYTAKVTVTNISSSTWTSGSNIKLISTGNAKNAWNHSPGTLKNGERIGPGDNKTFEIQLTAPDRTGIYGIQFQLTRGGNTISSNSKAKMIVVEDKVNRVKFISQLLPEKMETGQEYAVVVQFRNNGTSTWSRNRDYQLGLKSQKDVWNTSIERIGKNSTIAPGEIVTFQFNLKAPDKSGIYPIQWQ
ncbi:MAG: NBR1-Ig-like domain-containing protein, partial [Gammaproteobacteria bacterium]|nr:NBR1-Ig-like domain-containing protein [Gammaproteobacteria bacterium]